jgi:hypothetical protein
MAPLEWDVILAAKPTSLSEEDADKFFDMLKDAKAVNITSSSFCL